MHLCIIKRGPKKPNHSRLRVHHLFLLRQSVSYASDVLYFEWQRGRDNSLSSSDRASGSSNTACQHLKERWDGVHV